MLVSWEWRSAAEAGVHSILWHYSGLIILVDSGGSRGGYGEKPVLSLVSSEIHV